MKKLITILLLSISTNIVAQEKKEAFEITNAICGVVTDSTSQLITKSRTVYWVNRKLEVYKHYDVLAEQKIKTIGNKRYLLVLDIYRTEGQKALDQRALTKGVIKLKN